MRELEAEIHKMSMNGEKELMALKIELERLRIRCVCFLQYIALVVLSRELIAPLLIPPQQTRNQ